MRRCSLCGDDGHHEGFHDVHVDPVVDDRCFYLATRPGERCALPAGHDGDHRPVDGDDGARGPEAHPEQDLDVLQLELDACRAEIARLRSENERLRSHLVEHECVLAEGES